MKKTLIIILTLWTVLSYGQGREKNFTVSNKLTVVNEIELDDSSVVAITEGDTLATKEWTIANAAILTGNPNEIYFNSNGILGSSPRFTYDPLDSTLTVDSLLLANGQKIYWNANEYTIDIPTGLGPVLQAGQEIYILIYNDGSQTIDDCTVLRPLAAIDVGGIIFPTVEKAISNTFSGIEGTIMVSTMDIPPGSVGVATRFGKVRSCNTSAFSPGDGLFISAVDSGELVNTRPAFPNYEISVGGVLVADNDSGQIIVSITRDVSYTFNNFWNGTFRETFDFRTISDGTTIKGYIKPANGHADMTAMFSDGFYLYDTSPADTIILTAGTDENPQTNYIYVPQSTKVLTVSTSDWPTTEHIKVAQVLLQSSLTTQNNGALRNQNWNDEIQNTNTNQGHLSHIGEKLRAFEAQWYSGAEGSVTIGGGNEVWVSNTQGSVRQAHLQTFPALDMQTGDSLSVVNDFTKTYDWVGDLKDITTDATGNALLNTSFSVVVWGVANKSGEASHLMANFPSSTYSKNSPDNAVIDALNFSVYDIPTDFQGVGFLIARFTFVDNSGVWTLYDTENLRGRIPNTTAGGGAGGTGVTTFSGLTDTESSYTPGEFQIVNQSGNALESPSGITYNDSLKVVGNIIGDTLKAKESILTGDSLYFTKLDQSFVNGTFFISNRKDFTGISTAKTESGEFNTFVGYNTGLNAILSKKNTAFGYGALEHADSGWGNTCVGHLAGNKITGWFDIIANDGKGYANTMIGSGAGKNTTLGGYNTFLGVDAGIENVTGSRNTFVGTHSGNNNTTGIYNTYLGWRAGSDNQTGIYNTCLGPLAGFANIGDYAVLIGLNAGYNNEADYTVAIGRNAGVDNTTGTDNFYLGRNSGFVNTTGVSSVLIGSEAGRNWNGGGLNIYIGHQAGYGVSSGSRLWNTIIGGQAGFNNWKSGNTFIGYQTGYLNAVGQNNVFIGHQAGYNELGSNQLYIENTNATKFNSLIWGDFLNDSLRIGGSAVINDILAITNDSIIADSMIVAMSGIKFGDGSIQLAASASLDGFTDSDNTALGIGAGDNITSGTQNVFMGRNAANGATTGSRNVTLGHQARSGSTANDNVNIGYQSGFNNSSGSRNVFIGTNSGLTNLASDNVFIGYEAGKNETGSDLLYISNTNTSTPLIYGNFSTKTLTINDTLEVTGGIKGAINVVKAEILHTNTTQTTIVTLPPNAVIWDIGLEVVTSFDGTGTDIINAGVTGESDRFLSESSAGTFFYLRDFLSTIANVPERMTGSTNITFQYLDQNSDATQGQAYIYIHYSLD